MWLKAPNITCKHGFSTRFGGISSGAFESLNLGGSDDLQENIQTNRQIALAKLQLSNNDLCNLKQVHGTDVLIAKKGQQQGDALVSNQKDLVLAVSIADCYPVLFHDPVNKVIGAAHAGWRGTVGRIAVNTINEMLKLGAQKQHIQVAIGQGISKDKFEVGYEVVEQFANNGFPQHLLENNHIDLAACNEFVLNEIGISSEQIWQMHRCTFENDFFSYRRDKGNTGRMWGIISL
ncbi:MAG: peptidoglycan editing factor PgeF [Sphingobacteriaceae bacterium]|jgi:YfiH family protein